MINKAHYLAFLVLNSTILAADITRPQPGSPERKAVLDALRPPLVKLAGRDVKFLYPEIEITEGWALVRSRFEAADEKPLPQVFDLNYVGMARLANGRWDLQSWKLAASGEALTSVRNDCPSAPEILFNSPSTVGSAAMSRSATGFWLGADGVPVVAASPWPEDDLDEDSKPRAKQFTSWPSEGHGPTRKTIWKAQVWKKHVAEDGTVIVGMVPESNPDVATASREHLERLEIVLF